MSIARALNTQCKLVIYVACMELMFLLMLVNVFDHVRKGHQTDISMRLERVNLTLDIL